MPVVEGGNASETTAGLPVAAACWGRRGFISRRVGCKNADQTHRSGAKHPQGSFMTLRRSDVCFFYPKVTLSVSAQNKKKIIIIMIIKTGSKTTVKL